MRRTARRPGLALIMVLANVTLIFMTWGLADRQCSALLGVEQALDGRSRRHSGSLAALAAGLGLLESGLPPGDALEFDPGGGPATYRCTVVARPLGSPATYTLTFRELDAGEGRWSVSAAPFDPATDAGLGPPVPFE